MNDWTGKQLGTYRVLRLLDSGGFADVYLAEHVLLKTLCAVKVLHMNLFEEDQRQHFLNEARLIARLKHPHIIQVLDFGVENQQPFLVMDYAPHGNLRQLHLEGSRIPIALVLSYVQQTAAALQYAHDQHLIHRDIKPENLLLGKHNEILLSDFGIAIVARSSHSQARQDVVGTTTYMAPEQIRGKPRVASDQYALAVLAYEWLSGTPPFQGATDIEIARQHLIDAPPSLFERVPALSPAVAAVLSRALAKDYRQRFASVQEFATALHEACASGMLPPPLPELPELERTTGEQTGEGRSKKNARGLLSRRVAIGLGLAGGSAAIAALGWQALLSRPAPSAARPLPSPARPVLPPSPTSTPLPSPTATPGKLIYTFTEHTGSIDAVSWSPDSQKIVSSSLSNSKPGGLIYVWDALHGTIGATRNDYLLTGFNLMPNGMVYNQGLAWSHKGRYIASNSLVDDAYPGISLWTPGASNTVRNLSVPANGVLTWSPDDRYLAIGFIDGTLSAQIVNVSNGAIVTRYYGHQPLHGSQDGKTYIVNSIGWSPNGQYIATCGNDNTVQVWHALTGTRIAMYANPIRKVANSIAVFNVAWSPNSKYIASAWANSVDIFEAMTGHLVCSYQQPAINPLVLAWSPGGKHLAISSADVSIWDFQTRRTLFTYSGHTAMVTALAWSPNGQMIASGSYDRTVQVWIAN